MKFIHSPRDPVIQHVISEHLGCARNVLMLVRGPE